MGGIGDIYNAFVPSLTLGCGSYGRNSVSEQRLRGQPDQHQAGRPAQQQPAVVQGAGARPTSSRTRSATWSTWPDVDRVTIVTDATMTRLGFVDKIIDVLRPPAEDRRAADHRQRRAGAEHRHRLPRRRADARLQAGHDHRARRRLADGRRQGDVAALRAPRGRSSPTCKEKFFDIRKRAFRFPTLGDLAQAGLHPDHVGHRRRGDAVRGDHRPGHRQEVPAGRLRADPDRRDHRPGADRRACRPVAGGRLRLRRPHPRHRGVRVRLRQRLHRRHGAARHPADLRQPRPSRSTASREPPTPSRRGRRCTTPGRSPAWRSATRSWASCTRWRTPSARSSTWCTAAPTRPCCRT